MIPSCGSAGPGRLGRVDLNTARDTIRDQHHAVLATMRADGSPQMSPVLAVVDADGTVLVSTRESALKVRNLRRDPRAWLCVLPDAFFGHWIQASGPCDIVGLPEAMPLLEQYYRLAAGEHADWDEYRAAMVKERRVIVRMTLTAAGPDRSG